MLNHKERDHALLSASSASRWLSCTPSARWEDQEEEDRTSKEAEEGTLAHEIAELYLRKELGEITVRKRNSAVKKLKENPLYDDEMLKHAQDYADYVVSKTQPEDIILIEERVYYDEFVKEGYGTTDCLIIREGFISVIDFKYGKGVRVDAENNNQMACYSIGAVNSYDILYGFNQVEMCIFQPRMGNVSETTVEVIDLFDWAINTLAPKAELAYKGEGEACAGNHCQFCKVGDKCKAYTEFRLAIVCEDFEDETGKLNADFLTNEDYAHVLDRLNGIDAWVKKIKKKAIDIMLSGEKVPGYKVVEGRSNRKINHPDGVRNALKNEGFTDSDILKPQELLPLGKLEKLVGAKRFNELTKGMIIKPTGAPTAVPESDKRESFTGVEDFDDESEE